MKSRFVSITLSALICGASLGLLSTPASAGGISHAGSFTGPRGTTISRSGSCTAGAGCSRSASVTGPNGKTLTSTHSAQANGRGGLDRTATYSTAKGTFSRSVDTYRGPDRTVRRVTDTGANGEVVRRTSVWD
jgi:hypothetical protein